jgi:metacaspase-1
MCGRCGAYVSVPGGARSVRCPLCHAVTRRPRGLHHAAVGFIKGLISTIVSPGQPQLSSGSSSSSLHPLLASYPRVRGGSRKKRALLVGISYAGTTYELKGAVNDVNCMGYLLRERFNFPSDCILVMTRRSNISLILRGFTRIDN